MSRGVKEIDFRSARSPSGNAPGGDETPSSSQPSGAPILARKLIREFGKAMTREERDEFESFLDRIASEALFPEPASKDEVELVRLFPSGEIAR